MLKRNQISKTIFGLVLLIDCLFFFQINAAETKKTTAQSVYLKAEEPVSDHSKILLHGAVDMFTYAYKEAGISLYSPSLPSTIKAVLVGSPAYYASVQKNDKLLSASFKSDKLCLYLSRGNTPYYTEIRLSPASSPRQSSPPAQQSPDMVAVGFRYFMGTGEVTYIDPNSDLFGKVHVGDIYMYLNGVDPSNNKSNNNVVYPVFKQMGILHFYPCRQKSVNSFAPDMSQKYRQDGFGIIHAH